MPIPRRKLGSVDQFDAVADAVVRGCFIGRAIQIAVRSSRRGASECCRSSTQGTNATTTTAAQATTAGSTVQSAALADTLAEALQKKIADLLQQGNRLRRSSSSSLHRSQHRLRSNSAATRRKSKTNCKRPSYRRLPHLGQDRRFRTPILHRPSHNGFGKLPIWRRGC